MSIQAREIVRKAKRLGMPLRQGMTGCFRSEGGCAVAALVITKDMGYNNAYIEAHENDYVDLAAKLGVTPQDIFALEYGFEDSACYHPGIEKNRYYRVGRNVAALAGLN
jgi:hypothetical protein